MIPRDNEAFLEAAGYDSLDPGEEVVYSKGWQPTRAQMAAFRARDAELAECNAKQLLRDAEPVTRVVITNGREPNHGWASISVQRGGPSPEDCLHCLTTYGAAMTWVDPARWKARVVQLAGSARPVRRPVALPAA